MSNTETRLNGVLIIDKPADWTSHDVVAKLRNALKQKRIGHGGTLDPMATGVLPVFIGSATRMSSTSANADKEYIAGIKLGVTTDTQDTTGKILSQNDVTVTEDELVSVLKRFKGHQKQIPPMYSAIKQKGKKLYELARSGIEVERTPRDIEILTLEQFLDNTVKLSEHEYLLRVVCSKGTYIRTLCNDIGDALGCGGAMSYLRRTRSGEYGIEKALTLTDAITAISNGEIEKYLV